MKQFFVFSVLILFLVSCSTSRTIDSFQKTEVTNYDVFIEQNNKTINESGGYYSLADQKFNIRVNYTGNKTIQIFAYHSEEMYTKYPYPVKCEETVIFHPATALINSADENTEITLTINREMQFNAITPEKRINENNNSLIKIKDIADTDNKFNGFIYLMIYIDLNNNKSIEVNEVKNIILKINKTNNSILFRAKIYISTFGSWLKEINYPVYSNEFFYVKITNENEKQLFLKLFGFNNFTDTHLAINRIVNIDCTKNNKYVIFTPVTKEIELYNNPYHYAGENRLIFDTRINKESNKGVYVFCREYTVEKSRDNYTEMWVNHNGQLIKIKKLELN